jgi:NADH:ubiquinone oxidoreductase subunit 3 (subunit A)
MMMLLFDYFTFSILLVLSISLALVLVLVPLVFAPQKINEQKLSVYECGFDPFESARIKFDIQFYILAILFIVFDIELIYLLPWVLLVNQLGFFAFNTVIIFLIIIILGFYYEWIKNALDWNL